MFVENEVKVVIEDGYCTQSTGVHIDDDQSRGSAAVKAELHSATGNCVQELSHYYAEFYFHRVLCPMCWTGARRRARIVRASDGSSWFPVNVHVCTISLLLCLHSVCGESWREWWQQ